MGFGRDESPRVDVYEHKRGERNVKTREGKELSNRLKLFYVW